MKLFLLSFSSLFCFLISTNSLAADTNIYHWVDEDGKTHFSDTAVPGTEQIQVHNDNILDSNIQTTINTTKSEPPVSQPVNDEPVIEYQATIISPEDDVALRSNNGDINIHVTTEPVKKNSHKFQLFLDGQALGEPQVSPTISVQNIDRGTHQLQVQLIDQDGNILALTQVVTVHLQRAIQRAVLNE